MCGRLRGEKAYDSKYFGEQFWASGNLTIRNDKKGYWGLELISHKFSELILIGLSNGWGFSYMHSQGTPSIASKKRIKAIKPTMNK